MSRAGVDWLAAMQTCRRVLDALDWRELGEIYFHWGGEGFWRERVPKVSTLGKALGQALLPRLPRGGSSLWVGAGVAELPVLLGEVMLHGRSVTAANLRARECELLNAGLQAVAPELPLRYQAGDARELAPGQVFDHLGCISVFTDPETWPVLSEVAYGRIAPVQIDVEKFVVEREQARALAKGLFARLQRPGLVTTSAEEVAWFLEQAAEVEASIEASEDLVETAVVGDPVGFLSVR
ncbi:MAG: hypothetical protein MUC36_00230 [Planctomycetes bacterium]|jgi:hypothetical protein|nr:hypothetical protein [Planctomycetota bacterium]